MHNHPVVIVTGASRGVGAFVARWLGKHRARITLVARSREALGRVAADAEKLGGSTLTVVADVADEEPSVTCLSVRPGVVDTDMQALIRKQGPAMMGPDQVAYYQQLKADGRLKHPREPARSIAWMCLYAPRDWSGQFMDYDDPRITRPAREVFGE